MSGFLCRLLRSCRGSVLMEFVIVLPVYMAALGGIIWVGEKSLDTISLRSANHWSVWMAGNRFSTRTPATISLSGLFPRADVVYDSVKRSLVTSIHIFSLLAPRCQYWNLLPNTWEI